LLLSAIGIAVAASGLDASADILIDDFSLPTVGEQEAKDSVDDASGSSNSLGGLTGVLGLSRELYVFLDNPAPASKITLSVFGGLAIEENTPDTALDLGDTLANITWDGGADDVLTTSGLGGINFTTSGVNAFFVGTYPAQIVDAKINIEVWDIYGNTASQDLTLETGYEDHSVAFADFIGAVNWTKIGAVRMNLLTDNVRIDTFSTFVDPNSPAAPVVPVPGAAALGLLGMGIVAARRRKQAACS